MDDILSQYGLKTDSCILLEFGTGLINRTWKLEDHQSGSFYILQRINDQIFNNPGDIDHNIRLLSAHFKAVEPGYLFVTPVQANDGATLLNTTHGFYRLFPFITGSHSVDVVQAPEQAYEAARQFGLFTKFSEGVDISQLKITLVRFHDLRFRYEQFRKSLRSGDKDRIQKAGSLIDYLSEQSGIVDAYRTFMSNPSFHLRVTHHDTKISNVLFDEQEKGLCVIDPDTIMPGHFFSDVGDMMRTYLCPVNEEEMDLDKIILRPEYYKAILDGYLSAMGDVLTTDEKNNFYWSGQFMIYMQALRFLTDHLNNDIYYGANYPGHNFIRAGNQVRLLQRYMEMTESIG